MYRAVNAALNEVFLGGRFESRPLYLVLDRRGREQLVGLLADTLGATSENVEEKCCAVVGAALSTSGDPYQDIYIKLVSWLVGQRKVPPPFTALLFTLSRAAELMVSDGQFSSANYYERLSGVTGVEKWRLSQFGYMTEKFWRAFNKWLADTDFAHGRPTARAVNSYRYVGLAMSQAIVREEDRQRFHGLFEKYRFSGTDAVTEEEIAQYISNWIHTSRPTKQLKTAWAKAELRPRICEAAIAELAEWADERGESEFGGSHSVTRLSMAMSFRHDLFSRSVSIWNGREAEVERVELAPGEHNSACVLDNTTFASFATVEPRSAIELPRALGHGLKLRSADGRVFEWLARPVIPLARSEKGNYWTEVSRVTMGVENVVLVRADKAIRDSVEAVLAEIAQPGFSLSTSSELKGLPSGWVLYENVRALRQLSELEGFQAALSPVGSSSGLQVVGGLKIGRYIWHEARPPVIVLDTRESGTRLRGWNGVSREDDEVIDQSSDLGQVLVDVSDHDASSGNLYVEGDVDGQVVGSATILLRSAKRPRSLDKQGNGDWIYTAALKTVPLPGVPEGVRGVLAPGAEMSASAIDLASFAAIGSRDSEGEGEGQDAIEDEISDAPVANPRAGLTPDEVMALPCAVRGIHVFRYETVPPGLPKYAPINKECKDCHLALLHRRDRPKSVSPKPVIKAVAVPRTVYASPPTEELPLDLWFDAACFFGQGTAATFEGLVSAEGVDAWRASEVLKNLSLLGHCDLGYSPSMRPRAWSVAPPALSFIGEEAAVLCGFRNSALLDDLQSLVAGLGGNVEYRADPRQPALVVVHGLQYETAAEALDVLADVHARRVTIVKDAALELAAFSINSGGLQDAFSPATMGSAALERFDLLSMRWRTGQDVVGHGAFKASYAGTTYFYRAPSGATYSASYELVKLAAARAAGVRLHAYDEASREFSSVLGCEPQGLPGRALVACSGSLPRIEPGLSIYRDVGPDVASRVLEFLYNGELPS